MKLMYFHEIRRNYLWMCPTTGTKTILIEIRRQESIVHAFSEERHVLQLVASLLVLEPPPPNASEFNTMVTSFKNMEGKNNGENLAMGNTKREVLKS